MQLVKRFLTEITRKRIFHSSTINMSKKCKLDSALISSSSSFSSNTENISKNKLLEKTSDNQQFTYLETPIKSPSDKKEYSVIQLENGLTALLITDYPIVSIDEDYQLSDESSDYESVVSDSDLDNSISSDDSGSDEAIRKMKKNNEEKIAACALCVNVGSFSDPKDIPGLAHFLEHMVFMGSEKYPTENEFDAFIKRRGGSDNASTECEYTTFYFECQEEHLFRGMDIFSQFFISPLMKFEAITRERQAIESEFQMALPSDSHRKDQLLCSMAHPDNPANKFMWGNLITLRDNVTVDHLYDSVHKFRERHYSAHRMTLAVQARIPQEKLANWVVNCFSKVKNNELPPLKHVHLEEPFVKDLFCQLYYIEPVNDICEVELSWVLPPVIHLFRTKPLEYISWLIGDESKGSLLSYLKKKVWGLGIFAEEVNDCGSNSLYSIFSIKISLTEAGYKHLPEVLESVFSYIKMFQMLGPVERVFKEIQSIYDMNFKYSDEMSAIDNVESLVENMHIYPPQYYLTGSELYFEYNPNEIQMFLDKLQPDCVNIMVSTKAVKNKFNLDRTEKWFGTKYKNMDIPSEWLASWRNVQPYSCFHLLEPNIFIPTNFDILAVDESKASQKFPRIIKNNELIEVWFKEDIKFKLPQAYIYFKFISPLQNLSPLHAALLDVYIMTLLHQLVEDAYPAVMAEMAYSISVADRGFTVTVNGFNQKLHLLLNKIINGIIQFEDNLTPEMFEAIKKVQTRNYINMNLKVGTLATELRMASTIKVYWTQLDKLKVLPDVTYEGIKEFSRHFLEQAFIQSLIQGNISEDQALDICDAVTSSLKCKPLPANQIPQMRVCQLERLNKYYRVNSFNVEDSNCVTTMYFQSGPGKIREYCIIEMLQMILEEPLFDTLRTQEQLGYDVSCSLRDTYGILGFTLTLVSQANKFTVEHVEERMNNFLETSLGNIKKMVKKDFEELVMSIIKLKQCCDIHLKEEVRRNWDEIKNSEYVFDRLEKEVEYLKKIKMDNITSFLESQIGENKRKLTIQVVGRDTSNQVEPGCRTDYTSSNMNLDTVSQVEGKPPHLFITDTTAFKTRLSIYPINKID